MADIFYQSFSEYSPLITTLETVLAVAVTIALPLFVWRKMKGERVRSWRDFNNMCMGKGAIVAGTLALLEIVGIFGSANLALSISIPNEDYISISDKEIKVHYGPGYGFFFNKIPAHDVVIPSSQVVTIRMKEKLSSVQSEYRDVVYIEGYKNLRISYDNPQEGGSQSLYLDLMPYAGDAQFEIHESLKRHFPNFAKDEGPLRYIKKI